ncbi:unnamed protein product [Camellia sinensis]
MDDSIRVFCKTLASFCNHLQSSCDALKQSLQRRPIPLDSASSTFVQCLNRRVSSTNSDLNLLESMSFGTVSFEELLGNCNEVYKKNQSDLADLEDRLRNFGYIPEPDIDEEDEASDYSSAPLGFCHTVMNKKRCQDSLSLQDLGLSDVCLATIASDDENLQQLVLSTNLPVSAANRKVDSLDISLPEPMNLSAEKQHGLKGQYGPASKFLEVIEGEVGDDPKSVGAPKSVITVSKDDYESLPSYMRTLASWEDSSNQGERSRDAGERKTRNRGRDSRGDMKYKANEEPEKMQEALLLFE